MRLNIGSTVRPKRSVVISRMGSGMSANKASGTDWSSMAMTTPTSNSSVASRSIRPMPTKRSDSAISPVARLIRSPVWLWSWKAKGWYWTALKKSLRRS